jgi:hypothetical protein
MTRADIGADWTPRELRHTFVSLMSDSKAAGEEIARLLVGSAGVQPTGIAHRH